MKISIDNLKVNNKRHSETGDGTPLKELDFNNWWTDTSKGLHYLHVQHKNKENKCLLQMN